MAHIECDTPQGRQGNRAQGIRWGVPMRRAQNLNIKKRLAQWVPVIGHIAEFGNGKKAEKGRLLVQTARADCIFYALIFWKGSTRRLQTGRHIPVSSPGGAEPFKPAPPGPTADGRRKKKNIIQRGHRRT
jgi:hypothetical protein